MAEEKAVIELEAKAEKKVENPTREELENAGLDSKEIEMAEKQGLIKNEKPDKEKGGDDKNKKSTEKPANKEKDDKNTPPDKKIDFTKELSAEDEQEFAKTATKEQFSLYKEMKSDRRKRQEAQNERDYFKVQLKALQDKIAKLEENKPKEEENPEDEERPLTKKELEDWYKKRREEETATVKKQEEENHKLAVEQAERLRNYESDAINKDPKFHKICELATEVMKNDTSKRAEKLRRDLWFAGNNPEPEEGETPVDFIYELAKLHEKYNETIEENGNDVDNKGSAVDKGNKVDKDKMEKMINNSRKTNTAGMGSSAGVRKVTEDDLTIDDVPQMTQKQWNNLKPETKKRLMS